MSTLADRIRAHGWKQGSIVDRELASKVQRSGGGECEFVLLSQDCDVVHRSLDVEPSVELISMMRTLRDQADGGYTHGKNPRVLHVEAQDDKLLVFSIHERYIVDRHLLAEHPPAGYIGDGTTQMLTRWVAKRYVRSAFPDVFNDRIRGSDKRIGRALRAHGKGASGIFLQLSDWGELDDDQDYEITIVVVIHDDELEAEAANLASKLMQHMDACSGVSVKDVRCVGERDFTIYDLRTYKRWDFDSRSYSGRPGGEVVPNA